MVVGTGIYSNSAWGLDVGRTAVCGSLRYSDDLGESRART